ncbi:FAD binding domain-containing protein [Enhygromyxa salina]|uniref:4-hydroxybenzoyl-CoA reductase subunit beta n=1 Tax=Enhygromyxa salina TaxID=215803 RepID=A0A2S9YIF9_9BACT|nr:FAD binding domain-containing protein [Enhygromyxa salina]PRQ04869.1 4-hydroxybenzoyl-CoA reductase subunit beta [Enhygromyxa salina]
MIVFPKTVDEAMALAVELGGSYRAGGTDLQERRQHLAVLGQHTLAPIVDLRDVPGLDSVACDDRGAWIGAMTTLADLAAHRVLRERWPGVAEACEALANPQIRAVASIGGNLMQAPRCWYYRHPDYQCLRKGGTSCFAREGDHLFHVCFDTAPCVAPHPSTVALALVAYEAEVELIQPATPEPTRAPIQAVLGADAVAEHAIITTIRLGAPVANERSAYVRASNRAHAEWALAEVTVRLVLDQSGAIVFVRVAAGGVAPTPLRLSAVEDALVGVVPEPLALAKAAALARADAKPLAMTGYKLELLEGAVLEALERALQTSPSPSAITTPSQDGA